jgi:hypothetical protein
MSARIHWLSSAIRVAIIGAAALAATASSGSKKAPPSTPGGGGAGFAAPAPRHMEAGTEQGLWRSSFGPVKIEVDPRGAGPTDVQGAWRYMRGADEVIGLFWGSLRGNVLEFEWQEPGQGASLGGRGYLVFDPSGDRFQGKWWTTAQDRSGDWNGWRDAAGNGGPAEPAPPVDDGGYDPNDPSGAPPPPSY